jgi:hypothetical protein
VDHGGLAMTSHHHLLLAKLLGDLKNCQQKKVLIRRQ